MADHRELDRVHEPAANGVSRDTADGEAPAAALHDPDAASPPEAEGAAAPLTISDAADAVGPESANDGDEDGGEAMEGLGGLFDETGAPQHQS